ncbi:MAG: hypothetical protein M3P93_01600 [Actinomycetota bacterium]|nr:hypothetical protein [Actinomycetota bacterium]
MALQQDVAAARQAVKNLESACAAIYAHFGSGIDVRRLRADVRRLNEDLDLLCGAQRVDPEPVQRQVIEDRDYAADFWRDAEDEGLGATGRHAP